MSYDSGGRLFENGRSFPHIPDQESLKNRFRKIAKLSSNDPFSLVEMKKER